jgi:hypothetical protein
VRERERERETEGECERERERQRVSVRERETEGERERDRERERERERESESEREREGESRIARGAHWGRAEGQGVIGGMVSLAKGCICDRQNSLSHGRKRKKGSDRHGSRRGSSAPVREEKMPQPPSLRRTSPAPV